MVHVETYRISLLTICCCVTKDKKELLVQAQGDSIFNLILDHYPANIPRFENFLDKNWADFLKTKLLQAKVIIM